MVSECFCPTADEGFQDLDEQPTFPTDQCAERSDEHSDLFDSLTGDGWFFVGHGGPIFTEIA